MTKKERIEELLSHFDWEGGMEESLLHVDGVEILSELEDEGLNEAAKDFKKAYHKLQKIWQRVCDENGAPAFL